MDCSCSPSDLADRDENATGMLCTQSYDHLTDGVVGFHPSVSQVYGGPGDSVRTPLPSPFISRQGLNM